jgi:hypothetical protein
MLILGPTLTPLAEHIFAITHIPSPGRDMLDVPLEELT